MHAQKWELQGGDFGAPRPDKCAFGPSSVRQVAHHRIVGKVYLADIPLTPKRERERHALGAFA